MQSKTIDFSKFQECPYCDKIFTHKGVKLHITLNHSKLLHEDMAKLFKKFNKKEKKIIKIAGGKKWEKF